MAKRKFSLPGIQDLTKKQEDARALPKKGQHLIIGAPGTGKSILALLRARRHAEDKDEYVFLVFNHLLHQASKQLFGTDLSSMQWQTWFNKLFIELIKAPCPKLPAEKDGGWQEVDWPCVIEKIQSIELEEREQYLIIDEGQDMPPQFYTALANLGFENFFVVADQNQQICSGKNSSRQDIANTLGINNCDVIELEDNYRNNYPIALLAQAFYTGDPASPPPRLPEARGYLAKKPLLYTYKTEMFSHIVNKIIKFSDRDPRKLIGVIAPNNLIRDKYYTALKNADITLDNEKPKISTFHSSNRADVLFDNGGILVINAQACKGLEFDVVFIVDIHSYPLDPQREEQTKKLFYVMVSRAIDQVFMLKEENKSCFVDGIIPENSTILDRK